MNDCFGQQVSLINLLTSQIIIRTTSARDAAYPAPNNFTRLLNLFFISPDVLIQAVLTVNLFLFTQNLAIESFLVNCAVTTFPN